MSYPQLVSNLTQDQHIGIAVIGESVEDSGLEFCQYYGERTNCEMFDEDVCSHDGNLWGSNDMGSPYFCTKHNFPEEQLGYEFVVMQPYRPTPSAAAVEYMTNQIMPGNRKAGCTCPYSSQAYAAGGWLHKAGCPSPSVECLPNAGRLLEALRAGAGRVH